MLVTLAVLALVAYGGWRAFDYAEETYPQHLPWTPLSLDDPIGHATSLKVAALSGDKPACLALFETSDLAVTPFEDRMETEQCGYVDAVTLDRMTAGYSPSTVRLSCPLAAALGIWEQDVVQPAARRVLGSEVASIRQLGTYSCRRLYGRESGNWSQHATAQAIDIAGFTLADGRSISLAGDWGADSDAGAFLLEIRNRGCGVFGTMLGPEYNAAHRDHFHLQANGYGTCR
ncbi:extensin-like protein [Pacificimonas flava]|uniref:Extensin-like protein n=2 Tax=Pacificimonas flava TaxID=1234595 RepID=M2TDE8_9SPHN|nr:extensin-like protein [Pacificimonas flava]